MNPFEPVMPLQVEEAEIEPRYPGLNLLCSVLAVILLVSFLVFVVPCAVIVWKAAF